MSESGVVKKEGWKEKVQLSRETGYLIGIAFLGGFTFAKMRPYFVKPQLAKPFIRSSENEYARTIDPSLKLADAPPMRGGKASSRMTNLGHEGSIQTNTGGKPRVLERPMFDGQSVTIRAELLTSIHSSSGDPSVEARVVAVVGPEQTADIESRNVINGTLRGFAEPQIDTKRYLVRFNELLTSDGKVVSITGVAFNPRDRSLGVSADYSSGLASRLIGTAVNRAIVTAEQVVTSRILENRPDDLVNVELNRTLRSTTSESAGTLGDEATRSLRNTKAVLSLRSGTLFYVKVQPQRQMGVR